MYIICPLTFQPKRTLSPVVPHNYHPCPRTRVRLHRIPFRFFSFFFFLVLFLFRLGKTQAECFFIPWFQPFPRLNIRVSTFAQPSSTSPHGSHRPGSFSAKRNAINTSPHNSHSTSPHPGELHHTSSTLRRT